MKIKEYKLALVLTVAFVFSVHGGAILPFSEGFQNNNVGDQITASPWVASGAPPTVESGPVSPDGSSRLLYSPSRITLELALDSDLNTNIWWSAYAKVLAYTNEPVVGDAVAAFFLKDDGKLYAYNDDDWLEIGSGFNPAGWHAFAVHLDFASQRYDVYAGKSPYKHGTPLALMNTAAPLKFNEAYSTNELTQVVTSGETYLDLIALVRGNVQPVDEAVASLDKVKIAEAKADEITLMNMLSGATLRYFGNDTTMTGAFGSALASALKNGDQFGVYDTGTQNWMTLTANGAGGWISGPNDPADIVIGPATGMWLNFTDSDPRIPTYATAFGIETTHSGTVPIAQGWNLLSLPFTAGNKSLLEMALPVADGDIIMVNLNGRSYQRRVYNNGWRPNAGLSIPAGSGFWYYKNASPTDWDLDAL